MMLAFMTLMTLVWSAVAWATEWEWAYAVVAVHMGILCAGADSMV